MNILNKILLASILIAAAGCDAVKGIKISHSDNDKFITITNNAEKDLIYRDILASHRGAIADIYDEYNKNIFNGFVLTVIDQSGNTYLTCGSIYPSSEYGIYKVSELKSGDSVDMLTLPSADYYLACNKDIESLSWQILYISSKINNSVRLDNSNDYKILYKSNLIPFKFDRDKAKIAYSERGGDSMIKP